MFKESNVEEAIIEQLQELGYEYQYGPEIERDYKEPILKEVFYDSLYKINKDITEDIADVSWFFRPVIFPNALIVINYYSIIQSLDSSLSNTGVIRIIKCDDILVIDCRRDLVSYSPFKVLTHTRGCGYVAI